MNNSRNNVMQVIQQTPPAQIADLDIVKDRYIQNYNACHKEKVGDLMYHRNVIHFKQAIAGSDQLKSCDPFSLYACFATAAVNGYSLDPSDNEVYILPLKGKAHLWRQAGAHVRRLMRTNQIQFCEQAKLVYQGDTLVVENGRVVKHLENFQTENIIAGYVRMVIDDNGSDRFFIYRKSDWEAWKKKSQMPNGANWAGNNGQPEPGFLRTKIIKHACLEKCWATGNTPAQVDVFEDVEIDSDDLPPVTEGGTYQPTMIVSRDPQLAGEQAVRKAASDNHAFVQEEVPETVSVSDEDEIF